MTAGFASPTYLPITIVGAGLGGLALGSILHRHGIEATVLDLDPSRSARGQGGMLDIHEDSGQVALRAADLHDQFRTLIHPGGQSLRIVDKHGAALLDQPDTGQGDRPEVERGQLRNLLLDSLPARTVRWNTKVTAVRTLAGGRHEVTVDDGTILTTDLLVGADGAWSRVRPLLSAATPAYTGVSFIEAELHEADERHPVEAALVGRGMFFSLDDGQGFLAHRQPDGSLHVYTCLTIDEHAAAALPVTDPAAIKNVMLSLFDDWDDGLRGLVEHADTAFVTRPIYALPVQHRWDRVAGVTLVGDAAHLMPPVGEGANLAMQDGAELALAIAAHPDDLDAALLQYEHQMFPRSAAAATASAASLQMLLEQNGAANLAALFANEGPQHEPTSPMPQPEPQS